MCVLACCWYRASLFRLAFIIRFQKRNFPILSSEQLFYNFLSVSLEVSRRARNKLFIFISFRVHFALFTVPQIKAKQHKRKQILWFKNSLNAEVQTCNLTVICRREIEHFFIWCFCYARLNVNYFSEKAKTQRWKAFWLEVTGSWTTASMKIVFFYGGRLILFFFSWAE